jgi:hypothetical protein
VTVRWNGTDADGDALTYDIEYSTDGGASWQLLGTRLTGSEATLSLERLPGSQQARFRVWATDGVNSATDASDGNFAVPAKSPIAGILAPNPGLRTTFGQLITFDGSAVDPEDGSLPDGSLAWSSNLAGPLGAGSLLQTSELITGTHKITLTAVDSQGLTGSATITVQVGLEASYLPLVLR